MASPVYYLPKLTGCQYYSTWASVSWLFLKQHSVGSNRTIRLITCFPSLRIMASQATGVLEIKKKCHTKHPNPSFLRLVILRGEGGNEERLKMSRGKIGEPQDFEWNYGGLTADGDKLIKCDHPDGSFGSFLRAG